MPAASANILVALSGGVDSSVAAALLLDAGHTVVGVTCVFAGSMDAPTIPSSASLRAARGLADFLGIKHEVIDARERFERTVLEPFACGYAAGITPNPCVACNPTAKFGALVDAADELDCDLIATGHYALVEDAFDERGTRVSRLLKRGSDATKDQSYFLYRLDPDVLERLVFPLAGLTKLEVRAIAFKKRLPTACSPESQDVCFADADGRYASTICRFAPQAFTPGEIVDTMGEVLGTHTGIANYTVGQRKGLGIAAPDPLYVRRIDAASNTVVVGSADELLTREIIARDLIVHAPLAEGRVEVKIRHGMAPVGAHVAREGAYLRCILDEPLSGVAPGQSLVCYRGDSVICGGIIA